MFGKIARTLDLGEMRVWEAVHEGGTQIGEHEHQRAVVSMVLRGSLTIATTGREDVGRAGAVLVVAPGLRHRNRFPDGDVVVLNAEYAPEVFARFEPHVPASRSPIVVAAEALSELPRRVRGEFEIGDPVSRFALRGLLLELVVQCVRAGRDPRWSDPGSSWAETARYLESNLASPVSRTVLARAIGRAPEEISREFAAAFGVSIADYVRSKRLSRAAECLVEGRDSIGEIALRTGFSDQAHFCRLFKRMMGVAPLRYRKRAARVEFHDLAVD